MENPFSNLLPNVCDRCLDTGIWLTPRREVAVCPSIQLGNPHEEPNAAATILRRAANRLFDNQIFVNSQVFDLARILCSFDSENPLKRQQIFDLFWAETELSETQKLRKFHAFIEELRQVWLLPVGSRKSNNRKARLCGYWICTELDDYKAWFQRTMSAPITQLSTLHKNAKHNFPVFAEQIELEFWRDLSDVD